MATIKRKKVSNKATKGVKRDRKPFYKFKKFWIILSTFIVLAVGVGVTIILVNHFKDSDTEDREALNYFGGESTALIEKVNKELVEKAKSNPNMSYDADYKPSFTKIGLDGIKMHSTDVSSVSDAYIEHMFIFATDLTKFFPDETIDDDIDDDDEELYSKVQYELYKQLTYFQYCIDMENKALEQAAKDASDEVQYKIRLYIVDTSLAVNATIYNDSIFTGIETDENDELNAMFALISHGSVQKKYKSDNDIFATCTTISDTTKISTTCIPNSINYMDNNFVK
ncbi:MAG: hypothetical protein K6E20_06360 [Acholeplasmatales bacterium]|nr:hypothetical protein [Acholeplasmatales bacterium]